MIRIARPKARTLALVALPVVAVAITVPTVAMALENSTTFKGCLTGDGELYKVTVGSGSVTDPVCDEGLLGREGDVVSWNQVGQNGAAGATGAAGVAGPVGPRGVAGAAGAAGLKGANGANGVSGFKLVTAKTKVPARTAATYKVACPAGKVALGGGGTGNSKIILNGSVPLAGATGWEVSVTNVDTKPRSLRVYTTCASAS